MGDRGRARCTAGGLDGGRTHPLRHKALTFSRLGLASAAFTVLLARPAAATSALERAATEVALGLGDAVPDTIVIAAAMETDQPTPKAESLATGLAARIAAKLGHARAHESCVSLPAARKLARGYRNLVWVTASLKNGQLLVGAARYAIQSNPWERVRSPEPPPQAHSFASATIDAEIRASMTPISLEHASVHKSAHAEGDVLAVACGDVDGDGGLELVLVSTERIAIGKLSAGRFVPSSVAPWNTLAARVPVPLREPLGAASIDPNRITAATSERIGARLSATLKWQAKVSGLPIAGGCARVVPEASMLTDLGPCDASGAAKWDMGPSRFDAVATFDASAADGSDFRATAARDALGRVHVRLGARALPLVDGAGAQLALGDLDQDGVPELAMSAGSGADAITIVTLADDGPRTRLRLAAPEGVRALATCPAEERGLPALVAIVGAEVWLVR